jgi:hypothetical protein
MLDIFVNTLVDRNDLGEIEPLWRFYSRDGRDAAKVMDIAVLFQDKARTKALVHVTFGFERGGSALLLEKQKGAWVVQGSRP